MLRLREALHAAEAEIKILKAEEQRLRGAIAGYQARVENTPEREQEFQDVSRDYETTKAALSSRSRSATRRRSSPRAWSSGRRASSSGSWTRPCPRR